ncbi:zinc-binding dehydrogenase [Thozetella sp. PMI_491]|nr:zinc-binding dehydrogenase [Thozetella sp. PMI_491]
MVQTPKTTQGWELHGLGKKSGWDALKWNSAMPLRELGPTEVLVKLHAVSLNYRDIAIIEGTYPFPVDEGVVPGSDGAGEIIAVGDRVSRFRVGDKVVAYLFQTGYFSGSAPNPEAMAASIGSTLDGTFREHGVFDQEGLVAMPSRLRYEEGAVIQGTFATVWNCLMGGGRPLHAGDCVLVQGSGGISLAALQFAVAAGATVIATTSSEGKAKKLRELGASHVINYKHDVEWGATAKKLSPGCVGCTHVIDVAGDPKSFKQSLEAVAPGGEIEVVGFLATASAGGEPGPSLLETLLKGCTVRGIQSGSRQQLEEVSRVIDATGTKPVFDPHIFELRDLKNGYQYLADQKHFGKVVIRIS